MDSGLTPPRRRASPGGSEIGRLLEGIPAAPGAAVGRARIIRGPVDLHGVLTGEVLVCATASPILFAAFPLANALVTDTGGALSQAATIARECRIPAVVGTDRATALIHDGDLVRVRGEAGVVEIACPLTHDPAAL